MEELGCPNESYVTNKRIEKCKLVNLELVYKIKEYIVEKMEIEYIWNKKMMNKNYEQRQII